MSFEIVPTIEAYPITTEDLFNYGIRACNATGEVKDFTFEQFKGALNRELTRAFNAGIEYAKVNGQFGRQKSEQR